MSQAKQRQLAYRTSEPRMSGSRWTLLASLLRSVTVAWASKIVKRFTDRIFPPACVWVRCGDECRSASSVFGPAESSEDLGPHIWRLLFTSSTIEHRAASAQAVVDILQWPELIPVTDLASACQPIEVIVEQGRSAWIMPHFWRIRRRRRGPARRAAGADGRPSPWLFRRLAERRQKRGKGPLLIRPVVLLG